MAPYVSSSQSLFDQIDADGSGTLSFSELWTRLADAGLTEQEVESLFHRLDSDGDGNVSFSEFHRGYTEIPQLVASFGITQGEQQYAACRQKGGVFALQIAFPDGTPCEVGGVEAHHDVAHLQQCIATTHSIPMPFQILQDAVGETLLQDASLLPFFNPRLTLQVRACVLLPWEGIAQGQDVTSTTFLLRTVIRPGWRPLLTEGWRL